jgi:hypothetical protein
MKDDGGERYVGSATSETDLNQRAFIEILQMLAHGL